MKKIFIKLIILLSNILLLSSCFIYLKEDREGAKKIYDSVINSCFNRNSNDIKSFFAPNIVEQVTDLDEQINNLCTYLKGDYKSDEYQYPGSEETSYSYGKQQTLVMFGSYKVYSTKVNYYFCFYYCTRDEEDKNNVGVWNLLIEEILNDDDKFKGFDTWEEWKNETKYRGITLQ